MPSLRKRVEPTVTRSLWGGVWEIWQMRIPPLRAHGILPEVTQRLARAVEDLPYLERVLEILLAHRHVCAKYLVLELLVNVADTNATLWLSGYLLSVIATDPQLHARTLVLALLANTLLPVVTFLLRDLLRTYENYLQEKIQRYFILHIIKVRARLDAVTTDDPLVAAQLAAADPDDASGEEQVQAWRLLWALLRTVMLVVSLLCSVSLSTSTLHQHPSVIPLAIAALIKPIVQAATPFLGFEQQSSVWVAVARDKRYLRFRGLRASLSSPALRKEIVAGNLGSYIAKECARLAVELKDGFLSRFSTNALPQSPWFTAESATMAIVKQLPLAVLVSLVLTSRENVALLLGSLGVVQQVLTSFDDATYTLRYRSADVVNGLAALRQKCELINLRNKVQSGELPFPDDHGDAVSIEFENVSFAYPGEDARTEKESRANAALKGVSFKIDRGQFAVVVGANASGKSTIIKLLARLYDPDEGRILVNGVDIRTIRLEELRARLAVLFQDFAFFALTIRENIALGDPDDADAADVDAAAKLAGIDFADKFDKYLEHPAEAHQSATPGTQLHSELRDAALSSVAQTTDLSGGQRQKLAVARALVRAACTRTGVLVLDEPTAALDAVAESSLFSNLRAIRARKTVVVCSHRFGDLTRQADAIVHVERGRVVEQGTHDELLARGGGYATMWGKQAEAFAGPS